MPIESYGQYELIEHLATGGMAQIYLARRAGAPRQILVVKRILPHLAEREEFLKMFLDEARIAARLDHPNLVQIFDLGFQKGSYFLAMEYVRGDDLRGVWKRLTASRQRLPPELSCRIAIEAATGLEFAHRKADSKGKPLGIVHRDVSPQNILIGLDGTVKVGDFGVAKAADQLNTTQTGLLKGKYPYMSPEQASGERIDRRSDLFSLGIVLWELLTGRRLFKRKSEVLTRSAVVACEVVAPSLAEPGVPSELDPVVMKALAKRPADRYQTAGELKADLENWLATRAGAGSSKALSAFMLNLYPEKAEDDVTLPAIPDAATVSDLSKDQLSAEPVFEDLPSRADRSPGGNGPPRTTPEDEPFDHTVRSSPPTPMEDRDLVQTTPARRQGFRGRRSALALGGLGLVGLLLAIGIKANRAGQAPASDPVGGASSSEPLDPSADLPPPTRGPIDGEPAPPLSTGYHEGLRGGANDRPGIAEEIASKKLSPGRPTKQRRNLPGCRGCR